ncbi:hypothetical protein ACU8L5_36065 (plasmid) [Rhizobium leguminosarum]|jgi:hypothetical protein
MTALEDRAFDADGKYWSRRRKLALEQLLRDLCDNDMHGIAGERFWDDVVAICNRHDVFSTDQTPPSNAQPAERTIPTEQAFRKFLAKLPTKKPHGFHAHGKLHNVLAVTAWLFTQDRQSFEGLDFTVVDDFVKTINPDRTAKETVQSTQPVGDISGKNDRDAAASNSETHRFMETIGIKGDLIGRVGKDLFGDDFVPGEEEQRLGFETYRFSKKAGYVDKSYTVINSPTKVPEKEYVDFKNFYAYSRGNQRRTRGMVLQFKHGTYLLGVINDGAALKVLYINDADRMAQTWKGGALSTDGTHGVLAGRIVMCRTNAPDSNQLDKYERLPVGVHPLQAIIDKKELSDDELDFLRNRIEFMAERKLKIWRDGEYHPCTQEEMVQETRRRLQVDNKPLFIFDDGDGATPFNPAEDLHYTFNSALDLDNA